MLKLLACAIASIAIVAAQQTAAGEIAGRVTYAGTPEGIPGVRVTVQAEGATTSTNFVTDSDGRFSTAQPAPQRYYVSFYLKGFKYQTFPDMVRVTAGARAPVDVQLEIESTAAWGAHEPYVTAATALRGLGKSEVPVRVDTTLGEFFLAIDEEHAPITSANFLAYVEAHLYDGGQFHRATRPENYNAILPYRPMMNLIQGGINPAKRASAFPPIPLERTSMTGLKHVAGTVSMARGTPDSATSDFFILLDDQPSLDFGGKRFDDAQGAAAFGRVLSQLRVVRSIQQAPVTGQNLTPPIEIRTITRVK